MGAEGHGVGKLGSCGGITEESEKPRERDIERKPIC